VLDEATSALDSDTEQAVVQSLLDDRPDRTILFISHRPAVVDRCDLIVRLESGRIAEIAERASGAGRCFATN
jgi:ATP-binding cassette subfamily B protein